MYLGVLTSIQGITCIKGINGIDIWIKSEDDLDTVILSPYNRYSSHSVHILQQIGKFGAKYQIVDTRVSWVYVSVNGVTVHIMKLLELLI